MKANGHKKAARRAAGINHARTRKSYNRWNQAGNVLTGVSVLQIGQRWRE
jgi:hypothetical protein